jgi:hypothetical protein
MAIVWVENSKIKPKLIWYYKAIYKCSSDYLLKYFYLKKY